MNDMMPGIIVGCTVGIVTGIVAPLLCDKINWQRVKTDDYRKAKADAYTEALEQVFRDPDHADVLAVLKSSVPDMSPKLIDKMITQLNRLQEGKRKKQAEQSKQDS